MNIETKEFNKFIFEANKYPIDKGFQLIEASAGTGKTFSLAHIVIRLLTEKEIPIEKILIVSFTNATAAELRSIITKRITQTIKALENIESLNNSQNDLTLVDWIKFNGQSSGTRKKWISILLNSIRSIDKADITTIHGFCSRTLKRESLSLGSPFSINIQDNNDGKLIKEVIYEYWAKNILDLEAGHIRGLNKAGFKIDLLEKNLIKIENNSSMKFKDLDNKNSLKDQFIQKYTKYWNEFIEEWEINGDNLERELRLFADNLKKIGIKNTRPYSSNPKKERNLLISSWIKSYNQKNDLIKEKRLPFYDEILNPKNYLSDYYHPSNFYNLKDKYEINDIPNYLEKLHEYIARICDGPAELVWNHALSNTLSLLRKKRKASLTLTSSDLLRELDPLDIEEGVSSNRTIELNSVFNKLNKRYQVGLVDEFQDTDPVQWRILSNVFTSKESQLLILIGDPKQAIYKFRGGDLNTYLKVRKEVDRIDELKNNYRTTPILMDGLNKFLKNGLLRSRLQIPNLTPKSNLESFVKEDEYPLQIVHVKKESIKSDRDNQDSKQYFEKLIPGLVSNKIIDLLEKYSKDIDPSDICVLVNTHEQAESIRNSLSYSNLPTRLISKGDIFKTEGAYVLQQFINCLSDPANSTYLHLIACSPLIQWPISHLGQAQSQLNIDELSNKFVKLAQKFPEIGLQGCIAEILETKIYGQMSTMGRLLSDIDQSSQLVQEEIYRQSLDIKGAARWLQVTRLETASLIDDNRRPNSDTNDQSINVITIHRSKGLQFKVVICPYLWQSPPEPKGILWETDETIYWELCVNTNWGRGKVLQQKSIRESFEEAERLAYVAFTRAQKLLIIFWGQAFKQEGNPLSSLLLGHQIINSQLDYSNEKVIKDLLKKNNLPISISIKTKSDAIKQWVKCIPREKTSLGPIPNRPLERTWGRHSYSSWVKSNNEKTNIPLRNNEFDMDGETTILDISEDKKNLSRRLLQEKNCIYEKSPLSEFPRGANAGECLHRILENLNFQADIYSTESTSLIKEELNNFGIESNQIEKVQECLSRLLYLPLSKNLRFNNLEKNNRIHELKFDLPLSKEGSTIKALDIANIFKNNVNTNIPDDYYKTIEKLNINSNGLLTGSIDLIFSEKGDNSKWWIVDWKSNWIGSDPNLDLSPTCGPYHYSKESMEKVMIDHHYHLQAHIYLVALHRLLKWRLVNYSPSFHLGGYIYIFLRGLPNRIELESKDQSQQISGVYINTIAPRDIIEFSNLFSE